MEEVIAISGVGSGVAPGAGAPPLLESDVELELLS